MLPSVANMSHPVLALSAGFELNLASKHVLALTLTSWGARSYCLSSFLPKSQVPRHFLASPLKENVILASHLTHLAPLCPQGKSRATASSLERALQLSAACDSMSVLDYLLMGSGNRREKSQRKDISELLI